MLVSVPSGTCVGIIDRCFGVTCPQPSSQCHVRGTCNPSNGQCTTPLAPNNTVCDDGNDLTSNDVCLAGVCSGVDLCLHPTQVVCPSNSPCVLRNSSVAGGCYHGQCLMVQEEDNTECSDGNSTTSFDRCVGGVCIGVDLCANVTCQPTSNPCTERHCRLGSCVEVPVTQGRVCNDGNNRTTDDHCSDGFCAGIDLCTMVDCPAPTVS